MIKTFLCEKCNSSYQRKWWPSYEKAGQTNKFKFCGYVCMRKARETNAIGKCRSCNIEFSYKPYKPKIHCSKSCGSKSALIKSKNLNNGVPWNKNTKGVMKAWNKGKAYEAIRGENHHNWKGGMGQRPQSTIEYKTWRNAIFQRDNYTCQMCEQYGGTLHADHIKRWAENEELRYEITNGRTLCVPCHYYVTFKRKMPSSSNWGTSRLRRLQ